ncbi:MAG: MBOAT family O-acyltransferase [Azonexus sp.]
MLFNSYGFLFLYLPVVLVGFFWLGRGASTYAAAWLAAASLLFYGFWNPAYLGLLLGSICCNYVFGLWINKAAVQHAVLRKKHVLLFAIAANLALLVYYKYTNFFLESLGSLAGNTPLLTEIILPLGISFFTFTQIAFLVDTYQGKVREYDFVHYVLFVTFFPHLIAGPVIHHKEMMPQFAQRTTYQVHWGNIASGLLLLTLGLCKKTMMADSLAPFATGVFDGVQLGIASGTLPTTYEAWAGALAYTLQIYFDFSGYTDMALGVALMFNIRLPVNFNSPYQASSIIEFWRRWHMTLSRFLKDYLYIPLGGNQQGPVRRYANLSATMLLGGLWHGAGWTFVIWGGMHGFYLVLNHLWREIARKSPWQLHLPGRLTAILGGALTFVAVVAAWVVFRADNLEQATILLKAMFGIAAHPISFADVTHGKLLLITDMRGHELARLIAIGLLWVWLLPNSARLSFVDKGRLWALAQTILVAGLLYLAIDRFGNYSPFLYFQF